MASKKMVRHQHVCVAQTCVNDYAHCYVDHFVRSLKYAASRIL